MSRNYSLAKVARQDIKDIWAYIHQDNPLAARDMVNKIYASFDLLVENPNIGHKREDLTSKNVLFWTVRPRYQVIYALKKERVYVVRVLPADRDVKTILQ